MGVSYGGISQLFVGATRPPDLAAIAPLSVIDNTQTTLYPGGILNTGFALQWAEDRVHDALARVADRRPGMGLRADPGRRHDLQVESGPAPGGGQPDQEDPSATTTTARRSPIRSRRSPSSTRSERPSSWPASGPTSRPAGHCPALPVALHRHQSQVVHVHERGPHRLARPARRSTAGTTSSSSTSPSESRS